MAKALEPTSGRTVIIRGPKGEILVSSEVDKDSIDKLVKAAKEAYDQQSPDYIS